jgi:arylformamidase
MLTIQKIIDISWPITPNITEYKDKKTVRVDHTKNFERDNVRESVITLGSHTGTHIDAPAHFLSDGTPIENLDLATVVGPCRVLDLTDVSEKITAADLHEHSLKQGEIILLKTRNSQLAATEKFYPDFVYLDATAAMLFAEKKVKAIGIDYLGIERNQPDHATHTILMKHNIAIIEGLRLADAVAGDYFFICLPLNVIGLEAAPARAVLLRI